ncbi:MAG TPA: GNVR domain-containing protein [Vicinamibacterales bacterium]|nr:GNVR domain-containing protein [Vicinamibacterales bacterium]
MDETRFDPLDYVSVFNRRKWWFIVPVALAIVVGIALVSFLPRTYQATTTLAIGSARVAPTVIGAPVEIDKQERMRAVSQQLLSRPVLERTARLEHMDQGASIDSAIGRLRRSISVALPDSITPGSAASSASAAASGSQLTPDQKASLDSYQVSYVDETPETAQRILNRLAQVFVQENSKSLEIQAQDTTQFIDAQLRSSENRLGALEAKLRDMKESYMGRLPEQTNSNLSMVSNLQRQLESNATMLRGEQDRLSLLDRQIDAMQQGADDALASIKGTPGETAQGRVISLRSQLVAARLQYTDKHPEVIRLKEDLADAEKAATAERTRPASDRAAILNTNPEYRGVLKDREATKLRIAELQRQQSAIGGQIGAYQARVEMAPRVEQQMVSLNREYDLERKAYGDLMDKKQAALFNEELQRKQGGEQFAVLVPAGLPDEPFKPKPLRVMLMAIAAGFVLGGAGVVGREYLDRSVHDARGLRDEFELPVLAEIPRIGTVLG